MLIKLTYPEIEGFDVPDEKLMGIFQPKSVDEPPDVEALIGKALVNPINSPRIKDMVGPDEKVLILVDDYTRSTPADLILPYIIDELKHGGVSESNIKFLIALGTHRPMRPEEKEKKLGRHILDHYEVIDHRWNDPGEIKYYGTTENGTEIWINRHVLDATFVIGLGQIFPHRISGYSGGAKIIQPGVCGEITTGQTHWFGAKIFDEEIMGVIDNPVRDELNEIGRKVGLRFIVNVVLDSREQIVAVVAGDPAEAHREGARVSNEYTSIPLPRRPEVIIIESHPADVDLWQAGKAIYAAGTCIKKGGVIILVSPCPEGISPSHEHMLFPHGFRSLEDIQSLIDKGTITDLTAAAFLVYIGDVVAKKADLVLVTPGIPEEQARSLNLEWAPTVQDALDYAHEKLGPDYQVAVIKRGGDSLPRISKTT